MLTRVMLSLFEHKNKSCNLGNRPYASIKIDMRAWSNCVRTHKYHYLSEWPQQSLYIFDL